MRKDAQLFYLLGIKNKKAEVVIFCFFLYSAAVRVLRSVPFLL